MKIIKEGVEIWATRDIVKKDGRGKRVVANLGDTGKVVQIAPVCDESGQVVKGKAEISVAFGDEIAKVTMEQVSTEQVSSRGFLQKRPAPEYEFEAWLSLFPDLLEGDAEEVIDDFIRENTVSDDGETRQKLRAVFNRLRRQELGSSSGE